MKSLLRVVLFFGCGWAWATPTSWTEQGVEITLINPERTPDRRYVLVHLKLQAQLDVGAFSWQGLCQVRNRAGELLPQAGDCGVDMRITTGQFALKKGKRVALLLYYFARPEDFPVQVEIEGKPVGRPVSQGMEEVSLCAT